MKKIFLLALALFSTTVFAQDSAPELSRDIGVWKPSIPGQCTQEQHDAYSYTDPVSGIKYAVWHPELDPLTECSFGHGHPEPFVTHVLPPPETPPPSQYSMYMSIWKPTKTGECTMEEHDSYNVVGPDNLLFPTWHPAVHVRSPAIPATSTTPAIAAVNCFFGHEHGNDPKLSVIFDGNMPCFGCVNYIHTKQNVTGHRHEDHVGHKVAVGNRVRFAISGTSPEITTVCDMIVKLHQGTHSKDAFTNNLHEQTNTIKCDDGSYAKIAILSIYGKPGGFQPVGQPDGTFIQVGAPTPVDSPAAGGERIIPLSTTAAIPRPPSTNPENIGLLENWRTGMQVRTGPNTRVVLVTYWSVANPSRYYDATKPDGLARTLDTCLLKDAAGAFTVNTQRCTRVRTYPVFPAWDDTTSPFNGAIRGFRPNNFIFQNAGGPTVVYTDAFGNNPQATEFPGSVRQEVSSTSTPPDNSQGFSIRGENAIPRTVNQPGVHAPN